MDIENTPIPGVYLLNPHVLSDARGYFYEGFTPRTLQAIGVEGSFIQENVSGSRRGVLRGLHFQTQPFAQGKLLRVARGEIFDVVVDLRRGSPAFGRWASFTLSAESRQRLWVAPGLAHGFCVISDFAELVYNVTQPYSPEHERTLLWSDPELAVAWPVPDGGFVMSDKDRGGLPWREITALNLFEYA